ncbi:MAG: MmcQ/YjbR family DNA-binding protein [Thermoanaerobaculia bacterium]
MSKGLPGSDALIERVRAIALDLPETSEKLSHGEPAFFVRKRMFLMIDDDHHGSGHLAAWCNAPPGAQESLVAADPTHFFVPPYVGKAGWLGVRLDAGLPWSAVADLVRQAHAITGVKKRRAIV